jgi:hypothetical protein
VVAAVTVRNGKILEFDFLTDPERLRLLDLDDPRRLRKPLPRDGARVIAIKILAAPLQERGSRGSARVTVCR